MASTERTPAPRVLLGVTGGIAAYKSPELVRRLVERGCEVQVVMSRGAREFVGPLTFQAVSGRRVRDDLWDPAAEAAMGHIELARWADVVVVAPATAHFLGTLAAGLGGDLLSTVCLATTAPIVLAPAMNQAMWANAAVQANRAVLEARGVRLLGPGDRRSSVRRDGAGAHARAERDRGGVARADRGSFECSRSKASRSSSRRGRRASRSIPCVTSRTAAPARWALRSRPRRAKRVPTSCS